MCVDRAPPPNTVPHETVHQALPAPWRLAAGTRLREPRRQHHDVRDAGRGALADDLDLDDLLGGQRR
jgi:hypothetical protein